MVNIEFDRILIRSQAFITVIDLCGG